MRTLTHLCVACTAILGANRGILAHAQLFDPATADTKANVREALAPSRMRAPLAYPDWWQGAAAWLPPPWVFVHKVAVPLPTDTHLRVCFMRYQVAGMYPRRLNVFIAQTEQGFATGNYTAWQMRVDTNLRVLRSCGVLGCQAVVVEQELPGALEYCAADEDGYVYVATQIEPPWEFLPLVWSGPSIPVDWYTYKVRIAEWGGIPEGAAVPHNFPPKLVMFTGRE